MSRHWSRPQPLVRPLISRFEMTQIDFYTHVENKLQTLCTLAAKALAKNVRMLILTPDAQTTEHVDKLLWTQPAIGFLPHCRGHHRLAPVTPDHPGPRGRAGRPRAGAGQSLRGVPGAVQPASSG